jgi:hypothetical protein
MSPQKRRLILLTTSTPRIPTCFQAERPQACCDGSPDLGRLVLQDCAKFWNVSAHVRKIRHQPNMPRTDWSDEAITLLVGLFFWRPFREGDASNPTNARIAHALHRSSAAVDFQWRNISSVLRPALARRNVSKRLESLVQRHLNSPAQAVAQARVVAQKGARSLLPLLPRPKYIDPANFSSTCTFSWDFDVDVVLSQLVWVRPYLALSLFPHDVSQINWMADRLQTDAGKLRCRLRTLYAVVNGVESNNGQLTHARDEIDTAVPELLEHGNYHESLARASAICRTHGWCLDTLLK